jgi:hypothetical protein
MAQHRHLPAIPQSTITRIIFPYVHDEKTYSTIEFNERRTHGVISMQDIQNVIKEVCTEHPKQQELSNLVSCQTARILSAFFGFLPFVGSIVGFILFADSNNSDKNLFMFGFSAYMALWIFYFVYNIL